MVDVKLLPCPFCGSATIHVGKPLFNCSEGWVFCENCTASGGVADTRELGIEIWNTRAPSEQLTQTQQALDIAKEALIRIDDLSNFNQYVPIIVTGLLDQNSFDKGYKAAMYQLHKEAREALKAIDKCTYA